MEKPEETTREKTIERERQDIDSVWIAVLCAWIQPMVCGGWSTEFQSLMAPPVRDVRYSLRLNRFDVKKERKGKRPALQLGT